MEMQRERRRVVERVGTSPVARADEEEDAEVRERSGTPGERDERDGERANEETPGGEME